jgi:hypothetical protein
MNVVVRLNVLGLGISWGLIHVPDYQMSVLNLFSYVTFKLLYSVGFMIVVASASWIV